MKKQNFYYFLCLLIITGALFSGCQNNETSTTGTDKNVTSSQENSQKDSNITTAASENQSDNKTSTSVGITVEKSFKNGAYNEDGEYESPAGKEKITVSIVLKDNKIDEVKMSSDSTDEKSKNFQKLFLEGLQKEIIGKDLNAVKDLSRLNGSSLTSKGFNEALKKIKEEAAV